MSLEWLPSNRGQCCNVSGESESLSTFIVYTHSLEAGGPKDNVVKLVVEERS